MSVLYNLAKANGVEEALSQLSMASVAYVEDGMKELVGDAHGATKMYHDLREVYWWNGMMKDIAKFMPKCLNCQQVEVEHQKPDGLVQDINIPTWKWEDLNMEIISGHKAKDSLLQDRKGKDGIQAQPTGSGFGALLQNILYAL
ncbi:hypothetical protein MTR67_048238 [Solanum verrucosum]|uniref:Integrase zinc-binding domain-containing protein n=1 Tax=Solanum verrucosum TaxID=315347 RepID=A0AAF0V133_SOLVR|nr:hypothetical protein MTR67_048238 [Solanum verrucosum]